MSSPRGDTVHYIYGLCGADLRVRYVGQTHSVDKRVRGWHTIWKNRNCASNERLAEWLESLPSAPLVVVLEVVLSRRLARDAERRWIVGLAAKDPSAILNILLNGEPPSLDSIDNTIEYDEEEPCPGKRGWSSDDLELVGDDPLLWTTDDAARLLGPPEITAAQVRELIRVSSIQPTGKRRATTRGRHVRVYRALDLIKAHEMLYHVLGDAEKTAATP